VNAILNERIEVVQEGIDEFIPATIPSATARACQDYIEFAITWGLTGLSNTIEAFVIEISKDNFATPALVRESTATAYQYQLNRAVDGYPEAADFASWRFRVKAKNIYGNLSPAWTPGAAGGAISAAGYGTWLPANASISGAKARADNIEALSPIPLRRSSTAPLSSS
jgi:hypothetical protein